MAYMISMFLGAMLMAAGVWMGWYLRNALGVSLGEPSVAVPSKSGESHVIDMYEVTPPPGDDS
jgi:hypothetical protein